jgi:hypothetical protein
VTVINEREGSDDLGDHGIDDGKGDYKVELELLNLLQSNIIMLLIFKVGHLYSFIT